MRPARLRFRDYELDLDAFELRRDGRRIRLERKPLEVLILLAEKPGRLLPRGEIIERIWGKDFSFDTENGVNNVIRKIRAALNDGSEEPRFVETVVGKGYRFISPVEEFPSGAPLPGTSALEVPHSRFPRGLAWFLGSAALLASSIVVYHGAVGRKTATHAAPSIRSIVVLPLANLSGDTSEDYFADGMTELLTTDLGRIGQVRVISRTSAMRYKGAAKTIPQIARELNVDAVIEGGVARSGNHLRITAQLIQAQNDQHLWADSYEGDVREAFSLQDKVALDIAEHVQGQFSGSQDSRRTAAATIDPVAEEEYFRGRYDSNRWTAAELESSIGHFEQAVQRDPRCAPAWAGLAGDYELMGVFGYLPRRTALAQALTAAQRAVGLDSSLADAHVYLATARWRTAWLPSGSAELARQAWSDAEKELRFAVALNPNNAVAHQWLGYHLATAGQFENAIVEMKRARELDPLSPNTQNSLGAAYYWAGRDDEALREFSQVPDPDANSERRHQRMARIYERKGMLERAAGELVTAARLAGEPALAISVERQYRSSGYAAARKAYLWGDITERRRAETGHDVPMSALQIGADYALLGETGTSLHWLEIAWQQDDPGLEYLKIEDCFETLRTNPRFRSLLSRLGLPPS